MKIDAWQEMHAPKPAPSPNWFVRWWLEYWQYLRTPRPADHERW